MPRQLYFRDNSNKPLGSISHYLFYLFLCIVTLMNGTIGIVTDRTYFSQFWIFLYFNRPQMIIRKVPMETIYLKHCHHVQLLFHKIHIMKVPANIKHHSPIRISRFIFYYNTRKCPCNIFHRFFTFNLCRQKLHYSLHTIEDTVCRLCLNRDFTGSNNELISLVLHT